MVRRLLLAAVELVNLQGCLDSALTRPRSQAESEPERARLCVYFGWRLCCRAAELQVVLFIPPQIEPSSAWTPWTTWVTALDEPCPLVCDPVFPARLGARPQDGKNRANTRYQPCTVSLTM